MEKNRGLINGPEDYPLESRKVSFLESQSHRNILCASAIYSEGRPLGQSPQ